MELKRIYQRIIDANHGDCYKCSICTLLGVDYEEAPNFVEHENWHQLAQEFLMKHGYKFTYEVLYNPLLSYLENPTHECFKRMKEIQSTASINYSLNGVLTAYSWLRSIHPNIPIPTNIRPTTPILSYVMQTIASFMIHNLSIKESSNILMPS